MNEVSDDIEAEKHNQKGQEEIHKFREYDKPLLHFIFSLNLHEGSFVDLENIEGWEKYIELHTLLFNDFFECKVFPTEENQDQKPIMTEQFLMRYLHGRSFESIRRCTYHGVTFDVWSDGKEFEIIVDPNEFDRRDYLVKSFFACWAGEALVKTLNLDEFVRPNSIQDKHEIYCEEYLGYKSYYDCVLSLDYTSFIIYTYPSGTKFENDIDEKYIRKISENMWTNGGIFLRDRYYPPFQRCNVYIAGHYFEDYPSETREYLRFLDSHMKYWSMIFTLENFMGIISSFPDTPDFQQVQVRKWDALEDLLGRKINHSYLSFLTLTSNRSREHKQSKCFIQVHLLLWNLRDNAAPTYFKMVDLAVFV